MARYLYSVNAIVMALFMVVATPVGGGLTDAKAYARQGMYAAPVTLEPEPYRWRSLRRWVNKATDWWPGLGAAGVEALLISFLQRSGSTSPEGALQVAVATHVQWGEAV